MPYADPAKKTAYDHLRHLSLGEERRAAAREYASTHKEQKREYDRLYRRNMPTEQRERYEASHAAQALTQHSKRLAFGRSLRWKHGGFSLEQYESLLVEQAGRCRLCREPLKGRIDLDHDHKSGKIRGILHHRCNVGLPYVEDENFRNAALAYLKETA